MENGSWLIFTLHSNSYVEQHQNRNAKSMQRKHIAIRLLWTCPAGNDEKSEPRLRSNMQSIYCSSLRFMLCSNFQLTCIYKVRVIWMCIYTGVMLADGVKLKFVLRFTWQEEWLTEPSAEIKSEAGCAQKALRSISQAFEPNHQTRMLLLTKDIKSKQQFRCMLTKQ